jgi:hypothetical protein
MNTFTVICLYPEYATEDYGTDTVIRTVEAANPLRGLAPGAENRDLRGLRRDQATKRLPDHRRVPQPRAPSTGGAQLPPAGMSLAAAFTPVAPGIQRVRCDPHCPPDPTKFEKP